MFTFSVVVVDLPTDCILSFLFPAETDVLVPVLSWSTDVVVVNFVVVLKFPITFSKLELIMENLILDFKDQRSGTQLMIRLKLFLFLNRGPQVY